MKRFPLIFRLTLCTFLFIFLFSVSAYAQGERHFHPRESFDTAVSELSAVPAEGSFYLTGDISASGDITVSGALSLCLNGCSLDMGEHSIIIAEGGSLSVYDCSAAATGRIFSKAAGDKPVIENNGTFMLISGTVASEGRTAILNNAEAAILGGNVTGSSADLVCTLESAMLNINGGAVKVSGSGCAVRMIESDTPGVKRDYNVGIAGGIVSAQSGCDAAVVVDAAAGRFVLNTGAVISGQGCAAISVSKGNFDAYGGAVIKADSESAIVGTGGNVSLYFAVISSEEKYGVEISDAANLLLSGSLDIAGGKGSIFLAEGKTFAISEAGFHGNVRLSVLTEKDPVEGTSIPISAPCAQKNQNCFMSANPGATIKYENGILCAVYDGSVSHHHDGRNYINVLVNGMGDLSRDNYYLQSDLSCGGFYTGSVVNLCLHGNTLKLSSAIKLYPDSTLNIFDCVGGGRIESNGVCIQDINGGNVRIVVHGGEIVSHNASAVKLSGGDSLSVKGGSVISELEGSCAVEALGTGNSVAVSGGSISGARSGVRCSSGDFAISGSGELKGGVYAFEYASDEPAVVSLNASPVMNGGTADIYLGAQAMLAPAADFEPAERISVETKASGDIRELSLPCDKDCSIYFEAAVEGASVINSDGRVLALARSIEIFPAEAESSVGKSADFFVEPEGSISSIKWYVRDSVSSVSTEIEGADAATCQTPPELESGSYEIYCVIEDENGQLISESGRLTVVKDEIANVNVALMAEIFTSDTPVVPEIKATASTTLGKQVNFSYSIDKENYSAQVPALSGAAGEYIIYYKASAEGCDELEGELEISVKERAPEEQPRPEQAKRSFEPRLVAIFFLLIAFFFLSLIYAIIKLRRTDD